MSAPTIVLFLGEGKSWLKIADDQITERGKGFPSHDDGTRIIGVVPASVVVVHQLALADLTDAQATGAARIAVAENSASPIAALHVAVSAEIDGERTVVVLNAVHMTDYLAELVARGIDPEVIIAAPLILHRPDIGYLVADLGSETIVRGRDGAFLDDPVLTPLLTGGEIVVLDSDAIDAALVAAAAAPEVNLRQGAFARRRHWAVETDRLRRIGWLTAACLASLLILPIAELIHLNAAARRIEAKNIEVAQSTLQGTVITNPLAQLNEQLAARGGAGGGFLPLANAVASAAKASAEVELGTMTFDSDGGLHVSAHAAGLPDLAAFEAHVVASGLTVTPAPVVVETGRPTRDFTVRAR